MPKNLSEIKAPGSGAISHCGASRPQCAAGAKIFVSALRKLSRFALIAGGTPAVPVNAMTFLTPSSVPIELAFIKNTLAGVSK